jgi:3-hydroxyisobutyrate dehydrogenase-like beta-hydroxyacid dehydrogenase
MDIGFIGLGNMGLPMARRLIEAGHRVVVYDTRQEAIGNLSARGAIAARSPAEVAQAVRAQEAALPPGARLIRSCAGGMPPGVSTMNIYAFLGGMAGAQRTLG